MGESIIIELPDRQTRLHRLFFAALTGFLWVFWTYLWLPLLPVAEFFLGFSVPYQSATAAGWRAFADVLPKYAAVILSMGGSLVGWALYNYFRFHGLERRRPRPPLTLGALSEYSGIEAARLHGWQHTQRLVLFHDEAGRLSHAAGDALSS